MFSDKLYAGMRGHVIALDKTTGSERWRAKLKGADMVHLSSDDRLLYASTRGEIFALDPATGAVLWRNPMKGLGYSFASLLSEPGASDVALEQARARQAAVS